MLNGASLSSTLRPAAPPANPYNSAPLGLISNIVVSGSLGYQLAKKTYEFDTLSLSNAAGPSSANMMMLKTTLSASAGVGIAMGIFSLGKQMNAVRLGAQDSKGAMANVAADSILGAGVTLSAGTLGGLTTLGMRALGATGFLGMAAATVGGVVGGVLGATAFSAIGVREKLLTAFNSQRTGPLPEPGY